MLSLFDPTFLLHHNEGVLGDPTVSARESSLEELYASREFYFIFFLTYPQEKKSSSFIEKTLSFYHTYCIQRFVLAQLWERVSGKEDMALGRLTALISRKGPA